MKRLLRLAVLGGALALLTACVYDPGYAYVRGGGYYVGDYYYGTPTYVAPTYYGYYPYYDPWYFGPTFGFSYFGYYGSYHHHHYHRGGYGHLSSGHRGYGGGHWQRH